MTTLRRPPGRYDEPWALPRSLAVALTVVLAAALLATVYAAYERSASDRVEYTVLSYQVTDDRSASIRFEVHEDRPSLCRVHALDRDKNEIGAIDVVAPPDEVVESTVSTTAQAATVEVVGCRPAPQAPQQP